MIRQLLAAALLLLAASAPAAPIVIPDQINHVKGPHLAYASPWSIFSNPQLQRGRDYADELAITPGTFPNGTTIRWHWPLADAPTGVYGYLHLAYGNYDGGVPAVAIKPVQVKALKTFRQDFNWQPAVSAGDYNLLAEFYLTRTAGAADQKVLEVGMPPHTSASMTRFANDGRQLGMFTDRYKRAWKVSMQGIFVMFMPVAGDVLVGSLDMKEALGFLRTAGLVTGDEWVNGVAIGVEPVAGSGSVKVNRWVATLN